MKKIFTLILLLASFFSVFAYDVVVDGIYYNLVPKAGIAKVTRGTYSGSYSGQITIPEFITVDGKEYEVTEIDENAFEYGKLTSVSVPNTVTEIGNKAFYGCESLSSVLIPNSVISIGELAFAYCSGISSFSVPSSVTDIGVGAFFGCINLSSVYLPNTISKIKERTFSDCISLDSIIIPNSVTVIGDKAFQQAAFTTIDLPASIISIGKEAFDGSNLSSIDIPNSVTFIGESAFAYCVNLSAISLPNSVKSIGNSSFHGCTGLTSVKLPNSLVEISHNLFEGCKKLSNVVIPNSVTSIGASAFEGCSSLESITIPQMVNVIGELVFKGCENLIDVFCEAEVLPYMGSSVFEDAYPEYCTLHVPASAIESYRNENQWKEFGKIVALEDGKNPAVKQCATPTISVENGLVSFECETDGVEFISEVTENCANKYYQSKFSFVPSYTISVYATKDGYKNSEIVTKEVSFSLGSLDGDMNKDGKLSVSDVSELVNRILQQGM